MALVALSFAGTLTGGAAAKAATLEIAGPPGASLTVNGRAMGFLPLDAALDLPAGRWDIQCELPGYKTYRQAVQLVGADDWRRLVVRLTPLSRRTAWSSNLLLAGLGPIYLGHGTRGRIYAAAEIGALTAALFGELQRTSARDEHALLMDRYGSSINADEIATLRRAADAKYQDMQNAEDLRDLGLVVAGAAVAVSILDALLSFPALETGAGTVPLMTGRGTGRAPDDIASLHAGLRLAF